MVMVLGPFSNALGGKSVLEAFQREMTKKKEGVSPFK